MRQTAKLTAAQAKARELKIDALPIWEDLYEKLAAEGYAWDSQRQAWDKTARPIDATGRASESMFIDDDNQPSGVYRLRIMGHPEDLERVIRALHDKLDIIEVSGVYPNRRGGGMRVYLTGKLSQ